MMRVAKFFCCLSIRLVRLPVDLLFFSYDYLRAGIWFLRCIYWRIAGAAVLPHMPCFDDRRVEIDGETLSVCPLARKYANPWLLHLLCPQVVCRRRADGKAVHVGYCENLFWISVPRFLIVSILVIGTWATLGILAFRAEYVSAVAQRAYSRVLRSGPFTRRAPPSMPVASPASSPAPLPDAGVPTDALDTKRARQMAIRLECIRAIQENAGDVGAHMGLGRASLELGLHAEARRAFETAAEMAPSQAAAQRGLAEVAVAEKRFDVAVRHAQRACALAPTNVEMLRFLGACHGRRGDMDAARQALMQAAAIDAENPDLWLELGRLAQDMSLPVDAESAFRHAQKLAPEQAEARLGLAKALRAQGKFPDAITVLGELLARWPQHIEASTAMADLLATSGQTAQAIDIYQRLVASVSAPREARVALGRLLLVAGDGDGAYRVAQRALTVYPDDADVRLVLAQLYEKLGLPTATIEQCDAILARDGEHMPALRLRAQALLALQRTSDAMLALERVVQAHPDDLQAWLDLFMAQQSTGNLYKATENFKILRQRFPSAPEPFLRRGGWRERHGDYARAKQDYREALGLSPQEPKALCGIARLLVAEKGDMTEALAAARQARDLAPADPETAETLGLVCTAAELHREAAEAFAAAAARQPLDAALHLHLGRARQAAGDLTGARHALQTAATLAPGTATANAAQERLAELQP